VSDTSSGDLWIWLVLSVKNMSLDSLGLGFRPSAAMENLSVMLQNPAKNLFFI
jgi:hypothetical protein